MHHIPKHTDADELTRLVEAATAVREGAPA